MKSFIKKHLTVENALLAVVFGVLGYFATPHLKTFGDTMKTQANATVQKLK